jgi:hypothetical protein
MLFAAMVRAALRLRHKTQREPPTALPRADVCRYTMGNGAHCPSVARHAALNDHTALVTTIKEGSWYFKKHAAMHPAGRSLRYA